MTPSELLRAAKARIEDPADWCQGAFRRTNLVTQTDQCCALGALIEERPNADDIRERADDYLARASSHLFRRSISVANDHLGHAAVMDMYELAISMAVADEASR